MTHVYKDDILPNIVCHPDDLGLRSPVMCYLCRNTPRNKFFYLILHGVYISPVRPIHTEDVMGKI